jgi:hypothetical protein
LVCLFVATIAGEGDHFNLKWKIEDGVDWFAGKVFGTDSDHDGWPEIIMKSESLGTPVLYEQTPEGPVLTRIIGGNGSSPNFPVKTSWPLSCAVNISRFHRCSL